MKENKYADTDFLFVEFSFFFFFLTADNNTKPKLLLMADLEAFEVNKF